MDAIVKGDQNNLIADIQLAVAIGGATGAFVGTDVTFNGNWLVGLFGVGDGTSDFIGMIKAGSSTLTGFSVFQMIENVL